MWPYSVAFSGALAIQAAAFTHAPWWTNSISRTLRHFPFFVTTLLGLLWILYEGCFRDAAQLILFTIATWALVLAALIQSTNDMDRSRSSLDASRAHRAFAVVTIVIGLIVAVWSAAATGSGAALAAAVTTGVLAVPVIGTLFISATPLRPDDEVAWIEVCDEEYVPVLPRRAVRDLPPTYDRAVGLTPNYVLACQIFVFFEWALALCFSTFVLLTIRRA